MDEKKQETRPIGYVFDYVADVGAGQQFMIRGNFGPDVTQEEVEREFKKFRSVIEKHRTQSAIPPLKKEIRGLELKIKQFSDTLSELDKKQGKNGPKTADASARESLLTNIRHDLLDLEERKKMLAEWEAELK